MSVRKRPLTPTLQVQIAIQTAQLEEEIESHGYKISKELLWKTQFNELTPQGNIYQGDIDAAKAPYGPQYFAALQIFKAMIIDRKAWVHLKADMQAGKTGVINTLFRMLLIPEIQARFGFEPCHMINMTGMNDIAWVKQTQLRLFHDFKHSVKHSKGLYHISKIIERLFSHGLLRNLILVQDECHIAAKNDNLPEKYVYNAIKRRIPVSEWAAHNIHVITVSATDPARIIQSFDNEHAVTVKLETFDYDSVTNPGGYISVEALCKQKRVHQAWDLDSEDAVTQLTNKIDGKYEPSYHLIRVKPKHYANLTGWLKKAMPGCSVVPYDQKNKPKVQQENDDGSVSSVQCKDINQLLEQEPAVHTFVLIKNLLYAAKTIHDEYIGILFDRMGSLDSTNLQSFIGRACGYNKNLNTQIYTEMTSVTNYIRIWKGLDSNIVGTEPDAIRGRMPGLVVSSHTEGAELNTTANYSNPIDAHESVIHRSASEYVSHPEPLPDIESVRALLYSVFGKHFTPRQPHCIDGYYITSRLLNYYKKDNVNQLTVDDRLTLERYHSIPEGMNISNNKGQPYMVYPVYPDMDSPPEAMKFYVRYLKVSKE